MTIEIGTYSVRIVWRYRSKTPHKHRLTVQATSPEAAVLWSVNDLKSKFLNQKIDGKEVEIISSTAVIVEG